MTRGTLWTVPHLTEGMDILWTALDKWTSRPQDAHPLLGQVIKWTTDLPTAAWITARLDVAVTHTDHSDDDYRYFLRKKEEHDRTNSKNINRRALSQITHKNFRLRGAVR